MRYCRSRDGSTSLRWHNWGIEILSMHSSEARTTAPYSQEKDFTNL